MADDDDNYIPRAISAPVLTGFPLKAFLLLSSSWLASPVRTALLAKNGILGALRGKSRPEEPLYYPNTEQWPAEVHKGISAPAGIAETPPVAAEAAVTTLGISNKILSSSPYPSALDYHAAYLNGATTPLETAQRLIAAVAESDAATPPMRFFIEHDPAAILEQARASTARYAEGKPLSPLDGVLFAAKDDVDVKGYESTGGTAILGKARGVASDTIPGIQALLDAGAVLAGKANMHEIGLGTTGLNTEHGTPRNPHNTACHTGGSSSGSAAAVAAGLVVFATGSDGGGSIRIPAALCGCVGLKPTFNRVFPLPGVPICHTVGSIGPIAASVADCALAYAVLANRGHQPSAGAIPPPLALPDLSPAALSGNSAALPLHGLVAGLYSAWFEDAEPAVVALCKRAVELLEDAGLEVQPVVVPHLQELTMAHTVTISSEMVSCMEGHALSEFQAETRILMTTANGFTAADYVAAQKIRRRADLALRRVFSKVNLLVVPSVPCTAPPIIEAALSGGVSDMSTTALLMRFAPLANMLGLPAISIPVGAVSSSGGKGGASGSEAQLLPVGLQLIASPWHEATLLKAAAVLEAKLEGVERKQRPAVFWDLMKDEV